MTVLSSKAFLEIKTVVPGRPWTKPLGKESCVLKGDKKLGTKRATNLTLGKFLGKIISEMCVLNSDCFDFFQHKNFWWKELFILLCRLNGMETGKTASMKQKEGRREMKMKNSRNFIFMKILRFSHIHQKFFAPHLSAAVLQSMIWKFYFCVAFTFFSRMVFIEIISLDLRSWSLFWEKECGIGMQTRGEQWLGIRYLFWLNILEDSIGEHSNKLNYLKIFGF